MKEKDYGGGGNTRSMIDVRVYLELGYAFLCTRKQITPLLHLYVTVKSDETDTA